MSKFRQLFRPFSFRLYTYKTFEFYGEFLTLNEISLECCKEYLFKGKKHLILSLCVRLPNPLTLVCRPFKFEIRRSSPSNSHYQHWAIDPHKLCVFYFQLQKEERKKALDDRWIYLCLPIYLVSFLWGKIW